MKYLLDANAVIALLNGTISTIAQHARRHKPQDVGISAIVAHELYCGSFKSQRASRNIDSRDPQHRRIWTGIRFATRGLGAGARKEALAATVSPRLSVLPNLQTQPRLSMPWRTAINTGCQFQIG